jgi:hypothetical protein
MYEVNDWIKPDCAVSFEVPSLTKRENHSREINDKFGEGGGLNAGYALVEAVAIVTSRLARVGLYYGEDFVFKTGGLDRITFDFKDDKAVKRTITILGDAVVKNTRAIA